MVDGLRDRARERDGEEWRKSCAAHSSTSYIVESSQSVSYLVRSEQFEGPAYCKTRIDSE